MADFVHLHCHTEYSLLDGAIRLKDLIAKAKEFGCPAAAITDHGNLFGALTFYEMAKKAGIKPIFGCEVYVAKNSRTEKDARSPRDAGYHLVLLAQNMTGYKNLLKLVTLGHTTGFHYKPRVDKELLAAHGEGLIALSACLKGEVCQKLLKEGMQAGLDMADVYMDLFPGRFYLELQANDLPEQAQLNAMLKDVAKQKGLPLVATNDCHYLLASDHEAHDVLLCIQTAACVDDVKRMRFTTKELYYKSPQEMAEAFADVPEALANTVRIAEACNVELDLKTNYFPVYEVAPGKSLDDTMCEMAREGLVNRLAAMGKDEEGAKPYWERLEYELGVIRQMGFPGYFLIVQDFINWAKRNRIPVGPGRGSAAGSLVAYALGITNLDPLPYDLLFERFLNIERISMPDIDVDFCERRRTEVIRYVTEKYGADCVAQITTFGTMKAKAAIKDVGRAMGLTFAETDKIAKLIPEDLKMTIQKALELEPELARLAADDDRVAKLIEVSLRLEGLSRHASTHAAGVVISDKPMTEYLPLYKGKNDETVTQWDMKRVEHIGLIKFDFLGLKTMTVIEDALEVIRGMGQTPPDLDTLPLTDQATYELLSAGDTDGVFQVESDGMRRYLRMLKPNCFEDLIAMLALYRPGPLGSGMVDEFIKRKHGEVAVTYPHPDLEDCLRPTYGVIVYQEQVMQIARVLSGYSLGEGDLLRRAMGKKIAEEMAKQRARFLEGTQKKGIPDEQANGVFDLMEKFAEYGFNKSHSAAYALISYHTAFLKAHYPVAYMAALITSDLGSHDKVFQYICDCRDKKIEVLPADINKSQRHFSEYQGRILYGLAGVKNVGDEAIREIVREREDKGPYGSLLDLCSRVNLRKVTKRVLEYLIKAGAMDGLGAPRAALVAGLDKAHALGAKRAAERDSGRISLMSLAPAPKTAPRPGLGFEGPEAATPEWGHQEKMRFEKEALGFYLTGHPLLAFERDVARLGLARLPRLSAMGEGAEVKCAAMITSIKEIITKKGTKMAFAALEDVMGEAEAIFFPEAYFEMKDRLSTTTPLLFRGKIARDNREEADGPRKGKIEVAGVEDLAKVAADSDEPVEVYLDAARQDAEQAMEELVNLIARHEGDTDVNLVVNLDRAVCRLRLSSRHRVAVTAEFWAEVEGWQRACAAN